MKKNIQLSVLLVILMSLPNLYAATPDLIKDGDKDKSRTSKKEQKLTDAEVEKLVNRINEIKSIDVKELPPVERRELRKEVRDIRKKLDEKCRRIQCIYWRRGCFGCRYYSVDSFTLGLIL
ncbi:MAG: hypothetical protein HC905_23110 [Bacteroidales bacterium]|nr:hypothetical protein [Bacteroidales bacterium]